MHNNVSLALTILSAMVTPAILILACASLTISTSNRLIRVIERTREIRALLERYEKGTLVMCGEEYNLMYALLCGAAHRSELLHRALAGIYIAMSIFIAASVAISLAAISERVSDWIPVLLGISGALLLLYVSIILIAEAQIGSKAIHAETEYLMRWGRELLHKSSNNDERKEYHE
jgi:hypothetical protein